MNDKAIQSIAGKLLALILILTISCSTHIERNNESKAAFFEGINKRCKNKNVILISKLNKHEYGILGDINENNIVIQKEGKTIALLTDDFLSIKYDRGFSLSGMGIGSTLGFGVSLAAIQILGFTGNIENGGKGSVGIIAIPVLTVIGAIWGGITMDRYNTIWINNIKTNH